MIIRVPKLHLKHLPTVDRNRTRLAIGIRSGNCSNAIDRARPPVPASPDYDGGLRQMCGAGPTSRKRRKKWDPDSRPSLCAEVRFSSWDHLFGFLNVNPLPKSFNLCRLASSYSRSALPRLPCI